MVRARVLTPLLLVSLLLVGCATNPATGKRQLMLVSESQEIQMGQAADKDIVASLGLYDDPTWQRYVDSLGQRLAKASERPNLPWTFRVVDDPVVNAFALPGGYIYITRGILAYMGSEAELVSVLGHEIGHVTGRHSANQMSKAQLANLGLGVGAALRPEIADYAGVASSGLGLLFLKYGRDHEREADALGFRYMTRDGYDPRPMADMFSTLERVSGSAGGGDRIPNWMSTHPDPADRRTEVLERIRTTPPGELGQRVERDSFLRRLDGLVYGEDPRQGFFEGDEFLHPQMRFRMQFPNGWKRQNQRDAVTAMSPNNDGMVRLSLAQATSADAAARAFAGQQGVETGRARAIRVGSLPAVELEFAAQAQSGVLRGRLVYIEYGGSVYEVLTMATDGAYGGYQRGLAEIAGSFRPLDDPRYLNVQPNRLELRGLRGGGTLAEFDRQYPSAIDLDKLALLNGVAPGERLDGSVTIKRVVSGR